MIRVYLKDGMTVYDFEDAAQFRALLHDKPGHKPPNPQAGDAIEVAQLFRERVDGQLTGNLVRVGVNARLRFISKQSISHVEAIS